MNFAKSFKCLYWAKRSLVQGKIERNLEHQAVGTAPRTLQLLLLKNFEHRQHFETFIPQLFEVLEKWTETIRTFVNMRLKPNARALSLGQHPKITFYLKQKIKGSLLKNPV